MIKNEDFSHSGIFISLSSNVLILNYFFLQVLSSLLIGTMAKMDHLENDESENVIQYDDSYFHPSKSLLVTAFCNPLAIPPCNDEHFDFCVDDDNYPEENIEVFFFY